MCRRWQIVATWPWIDVKNFNTGNQIIMNTKSNTCASLPIIKQLLELCGTFVTRIIFTNRNQLPRTIAILNLVKKMCPKIRSLDFRNSTALPPKTAKYLVDHYSNITDFSISNFWKDTEDSFSRFFEKNKLQSLCIIYNRKITGSCLRSLSGDSLRVLRIRWCRNLTPNHFMIVSIFSQL